MPASIGAITIPVQPLPQALPAGAVLRFAQGVAVLVADTPKGAIALSVEPLTSTIPSGATVEWNGEIRVGVQTYTYIALDEPLAGTIPSGSVLDFPTGAVVLAQEAKAGSTYLYAHPVAQPPSGTESIYEKELISPPYTRKLLTIGGMRMGGSTRHYPYSLRGTSLVTNGGMRMGGSTILTGLAVSDKTWNKINREDWNSLTRAQWNQLIRT